MSYLNAISDADLLEHLAYQREAYQRWDATAKQTGLRSDRGMADEFFTSYQITRKVALDRGLEVD